MPNFFWLEGPLNGDIGARITATYPGQHHQCYYCLKSGPLCPGHGQGKACVLLKTPRARLEHYMSALKVKDSYSTLK